MIDGFKKFIARGNMIDMAVGVVMGAAVTTVVNSIVNSVINPLIAMIFGKQDMSGLLAFTFNNSTVSFGAVLGALINFFAVAVAVYFCIIVPINKLRGLSEKAMAKVRKNDDGSVVEEEPELSPDEQTVILLQEIRDALKEQHV
ncbi:large conductance mechanosensitive channel protein MscL [Bifidobacterium canis]|uniref:Large-conductance mechanosensitive channel n=1 Tax=Bifidobacterium canis TaxID=2610880 RepID=A0A7K1J3P1_9BIFI|nr:large conductance mechanosensitive channel protein MscL [Bifidobacterium canis]MUH59257.1 mechanosensitive ion channel protein MscL [Bifidobacterium canis]